MTPADLKAEGQMRSLFAVSDTTRQDFERILRTVPFEFSMNDCRDLMDAADIPEKVRGGLMAGAVRAGLIVPVTVGGYAARVPSTGLSAHCATVRVYHRVDVGCAA